MTDDEILSAWHVLNRVLPSIDDEARLLRLIERAKERGTPRMAYRVYQRYARLRAERERWEIQRGEGE